MLFISAVMALGVNTVSAGTASHAETTPLENRIQEVIAKGRDGELPSPIAASVNIPGNAPYRGARVAAEQATDSMSHNFKVLVERASDSDAVKPVGLELDTAKRWPGNSEGNIFHASLDGKLEDASCIRGKIDEQGKGVKGSGEFVAKDIHLPDVKKRFQHELDFWLKKAYLKKEWRSAELSDGELKK